MDDTAIFGGVLGQLGQTAKKVGQQIVKLPEEMAADAGVQISGSAKQNTEENKATDGKSKWQSDEERIKFLKDLYGSAGQNFPTDSQDKSASFAKASTFANASADKSAAKPEEQKQLIELRNQLHKENYYDPTFNPVKKQEERPAEKVEQEKKKEMQELQQKEEKKPTNWAVKKEQNKAEMFRGAAG